MQSASLLWVVAGIILCVSELFLPTQFIIFLMGISALIVAGISLWISNFALQVVLWLMVSALGVWLLTKFYVPKRKSFSLGDSQEGETLTTIMPGKTGRVRYEGNSWSAKSADPSQLITAEEKVYVVGREGNILIVASEKMLKE